MNIFDIITLLALVWAVVSGWRSGFVSQLLSLGGIILGVILAVRLGAGVGAALGIDPQFSAVAGFIITFVVAVVAAVILAKLLRSILSFLGLGSLDTIFGIALSVLKFALVLSVAYSSFEALNNDVELVPRKYIASSRTFRPVCGVSESIFPYIKTLKGQISAGSHGTDKSGNR